jgi:hypothetical protein
MHKRFYTVSSHSRDAEQACVHHASLALNEALPENTLSWPWTPPQSYISIVAIMPPVTTIVAAQRCTIVRYQKKRHSNPDTVHSRRQHMHNSV